MNFQIWSMMIMWQVMMMTCLSSGVGIGSLRPCTSIILNGMLDFKYGNTSGKLPDKYGNFRKRLVEAEIVFAFSFR